MSLWCWRFPPMHVARFCRLVAFLWVILLVQALDNKKGFKKGFALQIESYDELDGNTLCMMKFMGRKKILQFVIASISWGITSCIRSICILPVNISSSGDTKSCEKDAASIRPTLAYNSLRLEEKKHLRLGSHSPVQINRLKDLVRGWGFCLL